MALGSKHKVEAMFSMASMTDIIFLLLVFFMLTSNFITPSGLQVNLPSSESTVVEMQKVSVTITEDLSFYVNNKKVSRASVRSELRNALEAKVSVVAKPE